MNTNLFYILGLVGLLDTAYLIYHKIKGTDVACPFFPKEWCKKVQYSSYSKTLGVPNPVLGFFMYVVILVLTYLIASSQAPMLWLKLVVGFGFLFSLYFTYIQAFVLRAFCTWCVLSALNFTIMFMVIFL